ncbi:MAG: SCO family protein [Gammaproteobacteria bacterium]|nr:SCO family protein [Gammaproteobacteria bacterium]MDH3506275.1 SCO family protein [Gammaproteobacteria bacterium]
MTAMIGAMLRVLIIGLLLLVGVMLATTSLRRPVPLPEQASYFEMPLELPAFNLDGTGNETYSRDNLRGQFSLMFFGFTNCPDICPLTLATLAQAYGELEDAGSQLPEVVFVSVDPNRDTIDAIAAYLSNFDARFTGVTGSRRNLDPLLRALGVTVMVQEFPNQPSYSVTHNGTIYMIGPDAELIATIDGSVSAREIAIDFRRVRALDLRRRANRSGS